MDIRGFVIQGGIGDRSTRAGRGGVARVGVGLSDGDREFFNLDILNRPARR
jgi:hypothetical protein